MQVEQVAQVQSSWTQSRTNLSDEHRHEPSPAASFACDGRRQRPVGRPRTTRSRPSTQEGSNRFGRGRQQRAGPERRRRCGGGHQRDRGRHERVPAGSAREHRERPSALRRRQGATGGCPASSPTSLRTSDAEDVARSPNRGGDPRLGGASVGSDDGVPGPRARVGRGRSNIELIKSDARDRVNQWAPRVRPSARRVRTSFVEAHRLQRRRHDRRRDERRVSDGPRSRHALVTGAVVGTPRSTSGPRRGTRSWTSSSSSTWPPERRRRRLDHQVPHGPTLRATVDSISMGSVPASQREQQELPRRREYLERGESGGRTSPQCQGSFHLPLALDRRRPGRQIRRTVVVAQDATARQSQSARCRATRGRPDDEDAHGKVALGSAGGSLTGVPRGDDGHVAPAAGVCPHRHSPRCEVRSPRWTSRENTQAQLRCADALDREVRSGTSRSATQLLDPCAVLRFKVYTQANATRVSPRPVTPAEAGASRRPASSRRFTNDAPGPWTDVSASGCADQVALRRREQVSGRPGRTTCDGAACAFQLDDDPNKGGRTVNVVLLVNED